MGVDSRLREHILPHSGLLMPEISPHHQLHPTEKIQKIWEQTGPEWSYSVETRLIDPLLLFPRLGLQIWDPKVLKRGLAELVDGAQIPP